MLHVDRVTRLAVQATHDAIEEIHLGWNLRPAYASLVTAVAHLETCDDEDLDVLLAKANGSLYLGHATRELDLPLWDATAHHLRAARYAMQLNDNALAFEAMLGAEQCREKYSLTLAQRALVAAGEIDARRSYPKQRLRLISREGGLLELLGRARDSLEYYRKSVLPLALHIEEPFVFNRAMAIIAYCDVARAAGQLDEVWRWLHDEAISCSLATHNLIAYQTYVHRGFLFVHSGDLHLAARELQAAERLRLEHSLTPRLLRPLWKALERA